MFNESYKCVSVKIRENFAHASLHYMAYRPVRTAMITGVRIVKDTLRSAVPLTRPNAGKGSVRRRGHRTGGCAPVPAGLRARRNRHRRGGAWLGGRRQ